MDDIDALIIRSISLTCLTLSLVIVAYLLKKRVIYLRQVALLIIWAVVSIVYYFTSVLRGAFDIELLSSELIHSISLFLRLYGALSILALVIATAYLRRAGDE